MAARGMHRPRWSRQAGSGASSGIDLPTAITPGIGQRVRRLKVYADLPGLQRGGAAAQGGADPMMLAIQQLAANVAGGQGGREPKGVMEAYRETYYPVLLRYCQVATVDKLTPIWGRLACGAKGEQQSIITQEMANVNRGLTTDLYCPAVTTGLKQMVNSLNFAGNGPDDLAAGCQPFLVAYTTQHEHYLALDEATVANPAGSRHCQRLLGRHQRYQRERESQATSGSKPSKSDAAPIRDPRPYLVPRSR